MKKIEITVPGAREKFEDWIANRGGVREWVNLNLSNPDAGSRFTPELGEDGEPYGKPHWSVGQGELVTDINRFRFVKAMQEVASVRVALRKSNNGLSIKLTDASTRKVRAKLAAMEKKYGERPSYYPSRDDYDRPIMVIEVPVWEECENEEDR